MMSLKQLSLSVLFAAAAAVGAQGQALGIFDGHQDIDNGTIKTPGSASFDAASNTYSVSGHGDDVWNNADAFHYVYKQWSGDFVFTANVGISGGDTGEDWIKSMLMARQNLEPGSINICTRIRRDGQYSMQLRPVANQGGQSTAADKRKVIPNPSVQRFERQGNTFICSYQDAGGNWVEIERRDLVMVDPILVGLAVTAHDGAPITGALATGTFQNVELKNPKQASHASNWNLYE